jgi:hypothetical protein
MINLNIENQLELLNQFQRYYNDLPFESNPKDGIRYYFENDWYAYTDAIFLYSMIRHFKPKNIIEVGSGFSSSVIMDTNDLFFNSEINLTFIDPDTNRLLSLMKQRDLEKNRILKSIVQNVPLSEFQSLESGDFLFIDSSHYFSNGSDLEFIFFEILPTLKSGVFIHFHDIFNDFKYPEKFRNQGWNESYFLKSFLMYNSDFEIKIFSDYLAKNHQEELSKLEICMKNTGGNIWIQKK